MSSGNAKSTCLIDDSSVSRLPPGKSVLPIDPAKSVSPTKSVESLLAVTADRETHPTGTMAGRVMHAHLVAPEAHRVFTLVEEIHGRLFLRRKPERHALLDDALVEEVVVVVETDRNAKRSLRAADARDVVEMGVREQDVLDRQPVQRHCVEQIVHLVAGVDHDALTRLLAADHVAVLEERRDGPGLENHHGRILHAEPIDGRFSPSWV